ncbi:PEP-CTERM sorting domain-containing protein [Rugamonas sp. A1-17]|nr:PEP-CTERM sorting domain-containing protein [Rugamonas sp. A1-17]
MKKTLIALLAGGLLLAAQSHAAVVTFDNLDAGGKLSSIGKYNPYADLVWGSNWFLGDTSVGGYGNGAHSGKEFLNNGFGVNNLGVSSAKAFDFSGAWFAVPGINGTKATWIDITAYDAANHVIGTTGQIAINGTYSWVAANFAGVSRLNITRDKGFFVMDDFTLAAAVPEPTSLSMMALGLAAIGIARRRRAR